ncbi:MAG: prepilin-type N-terminal cleavage/methylation domain-containing protein, partial [Phycisphaeraceae bacterium]|nr:prepilin-type N-terminal cleavage/methylation domain-containing protein [Phycisphaeraceae bacterium]
MITRVRTPRSTARPPRRAFTLVEVLVAIGAVALLAVGIAQIFSVIGKTVGAGRRLSNLTTFANVLERRLRADVESITRDGFIVVRHDVAAGGAAIALSPTDASPR